MWQVLWQACGKSVASVLVSLVACLWQVHASLALVATAWQVQWQVHWQVCGKSSAVWQVVCQVLRSKCCGTPMASLWQGEALWHVWWGCCGKSAVSSRHVLLCGNHLRQVLWQVVWQARGKYVARHGQPAASFLFRRFAAKEARQFRGNVSVVDLLWRVSVASLAAAAALWQLCGKSVADIVLARLAHGSPRLTP